MPTIKRYVLMDAFTDEDGKPRCSLSRLTDESCSYFRSRISLDQPTKYYCGKNHYSEETNNTPGPWCPVWHGESREAKP